MPPGAPANFGRPSRCSSGQTVPCALPKRRSVYCPGPHGRSCPLVWSAVSPVPEYCAREELALVIDFRSEAPAYPWSEIVDFARAYPRLAVVALAAPLQGPTAGRALDAASNLVLET